VAARGQGAPGQMTWLKGFRPGCRPGFRPGYNFFSKEINVCRKEHIRNDTVSVNLPTAKICNQSQDLIHVIFIIVSVTKIVIRPRTDVICMFAFNFSSSVTFSRHRGSDVVL